MDSCERGMNPDAITIINPRKEHWPSRESNQRPPVHKSATLMTKLKGLAKTEEWTDRWTGKQTEYCCWWGPEHKVKFTRIELPIIFYRFAL